MTYNFHEGRLFGRGIISISPVKILLADDNLADCRLAEEAFKEVGLDFELNYVLDGAELMRFLKKQEEHRKKPTPNLIFIDINMPKMNGMEILKTIKSDPELKVIPVIILSTSDAAVDITKAYSLGANCYIKKTIDFDMFLKNMVGVANYWFKIVEFPESTLK